MSTRVTSNGQVTIPKSVREHLGIRPGSAVEFVAEPDGRIVLVKKTGRAGGAKRKPSRFGALRGSATVRMSTRQIMALTRGED